MAFLKIFLIIYIHCFVIRFPEEITQPQARREKLGLVWMCEFCKLGVLNVQLLRHMKK